MPDDSVILVEIARQTLTRVMPDAVPRHRSNLHLPLQGHADSRTCFAKLEYQADITSQSAAKR
jgi:hypothetical protein